MINQLLRISLLKTLRFNLAYFGLKGLLLPVLVSSNFRLRCLKGKIILNNFRFGTIRLGFGSVGIIDVQGDRGIWYNTGSVSFRGTARLGAGARFSNNGEVVFGNGFVNTGRCTIICEKEILFGDNVLISWDSSLMDSDFHKIYNFDDHILLNPPLPIIVENNVWISSNATILKGAYLPSNSVIARGALISKDMKKHPNCILGKVNAVLRENIYWVK